MEEFLQQQIPAKRPRSVAQSGVLVTAYTVHAHVVRQAPNSQGTGAAAAMAIKALQVALSQHLRRHKDSQASVTVVLANKVDAEVSNSTAASGKRLLNEGSDEELQYMKIEAGVGDPRTGWATHEPLEEMLEQQDSISAVEMA
ncbi:MAG: hypothetical protein HC767_02850 [Akkermansiaceae bacterium]|nr:hypothetical protein [Akkermansiaceae bacterium]